MTVDVWQDWRARAACLGDPDRQFPDNNAEQIAAAKRVCAGCPVIDECLRDALTRDERDGIWGGHTYRERENLKLHGTAVRNVPKTDCPTCGRPMPLRVKGLKRHNRWSNGVGWTHCPGSGWMP